MVDGGRERGNEPRWSDYYFEPWDSQKYAYVPQNHHSALLIEQRYSWTRRLVLWRQCCAGSEMVCSDRNCSPTNFQSLLFHQNLFLPLEWRLQ